MRSDSAFLAVRAQAGAQRDKTTIDTTPTGIDTAVTEQLSVEQSADVKVISHTLRAALACRARGRLRTPRHALPPASLTPTNTHRSNLRTRRPGR